MARAKKVKYSYYGYKPSPAGIMIIGTNIALRSYDGINWTEVSVPDGSWNSIAYSPDSESFVAVKSDGSIYTDTIGSDWTESSLTPYGSGSSWIAVNYGNGYFVIGNTSTTTSPAALKKGHSTDGINWNYNTPYTDGGLQSFAYSPSLGWRAARIPLNRIGHFTNGNDNVINYGAITWSSGFCQKMIWAEELGYFFATTTRANQSDKIVYFTAGSVTPSWSAAVYSFYTKGIAWSGSVMVVGRSDGYIMRSTDPVGGVWTTITPPQLVVWNDIFWSSTANIFIAVGSSYVLHSTDGQTWTESSVTSGTYVDIAGY